MRLTKKILAERAGLKSWDGSLPQEVFDKLSEEDKSYSVWCYDNEKIFGELINLKKYAYIEIKEQYLVKHIQAWIAHADPDELARIAGEIFGGQCFHHEDDIYHFTPDPDNYGGVFC